MIKAPMDEMLVSEIRILILLKDRCLDEYTPRVQRGYWAAKRKAIKLGWLDAIERETAFKKD